MAEIKNNMLEIIDNLHWQLEQAELDLRKKIKELDEKNKSAVIFYKDNRANWFKQLVGYMVGGLTYTQAKQLLIKENSLDSKQIEKLFEAMDYQRRATELYAKIYMIKTLKKADFTNKKIAEIMKISAATVARLLKCNIKF